MQCILPCYLFLMNVSGVIATVQFSIRLNGFTFATFWDISLKGCLSACESRPKCFSVNYSKLRLECQLNIQPLSGSAQHQPAIAQGFVHVDIDREVLDPCGGNMCSMEATCSNEVDGACEVKECATGIATPTNGRVFGNLNTIGAMKKLECEGYHYVQTGDVHVDSLTTQTVIAVCLPDGHWNVTSFVCVTCSDELPLVTGPDGVDDSKISASSFYKERIRYHPKYSRLHTLNEPDVHNGAWSAGIDDLAPYIQVEFTTVKTVLGIQTQGRNGEYNQWVTEYSVSYSVDCISFDVLTDLDGETVRFPGNVDEDTVVTNTISPPIHARCIRILPLARNRHVSLRFEVLGC